MASANIANSAANADSGLEWRVCRADTIDIRRRVVSESGLSFDGLRNLGSLNTSIHTLCPKDLPVMWLQR
jgi:hypothetical protein